MPNLFRAAVSLLAFVAMLAAGRALAEDRIELHSRPGVVQPILYAPASAPIASVVLFPGGRGVIAEVQNNFLLRVRGEFAAQGISVAVIDVPSDHAVANPEYRASADAAADVAAVVAFLKAKAASPVWLVGTSRGSISAANAAARLGPSQVGGIVLTSSVWNGGMRFVSLSQIAVPTLIVHNRDDHCGQSPVAGAAPALATLTNAPVKELLLVSGGDEKRDPCGALSTHGYLGIENQVVPPMIAWIKSHNAPAH
ncbi:MAG: hypothetical protein ACRED7_05750 [Stellaceae bacterium]